MKLLPLLVACFAFFCGCATDYRFTFPREDRPASSAFVASTEFSLRGSPAPEIALYNVAAEPGRSRPGVIGYVPTEIEVAGDAFGPQIWKHRHGCLVQYEIIVTPTIRRDKFEKLQAAITAATPGITPTLVPCAMILNSVEIPGTLDGVSCRFYPYYTASGDTFWVVRLAASSDLCSQIEALMRSDTGLLLPSRATLKGVNLPVAPPIEIKASVPVRDP
jgi:hypothetical protein